MEVFWCFLVDQKRTLRRNGLRTGTVNYLKMVSLITVTLCVTFFVNSHSVFLEISTEIEKMMHFLKMLVVGVLKNFWSVINCKNQIETNSMVFFLASLKSSNFEKNILAGVFLWMLPIIEVRLFYRTPFDFFS